MPADHDRRRWVHAQVKSGCCRRVARHRVDHVRKVGAHPRRPLALQGCKSLLDVGVYVHGIARLVLALGDDAHDGRLDALEDVAVFPRRRIPFRHDVQEDLAILKRTIDAEVVRRRQPCAVDQGQAYYMSVFCSIHVLTVEGYVPAKTMDCIDNAENPIGKAW